MTTGVFHPEHAPRNPSPLGGEVAERSEVGEGALRTSIAAFATPRRAALKRSIPNQRVVQAPRPPLPVVRCPTDLSPEGRGVTSPPRFKIQPAFTLIEVVVAIIILGLGVLGLAAVFAGTARQQSSAARLSDATELAARVESLVRARFGPVQMDPLAGPMVFNNYYGVGVTHRHPPLPTVWYPIPAHTDQNNRIKHALTIDTDVAILNNNARLENRFFVVDGPSEVVLYENPLNQQTGRPTHGTYNTDSDLGDPSSGLFYDATTATLQGHDAFFPAGGPTRIRDFPTARIHPGSLRLRFDVARLRNFNNSPTPTLIERRRSIHFTDAAAYDDDVDVNYPHGVTMFNDDTPRSADGAMQVLVNRALTTPAANDPPNAYIAGFRVNPPLLDYSVLGPGEWIERIVVESYQYRSDTLLTLDDRLMRRPDGSVVGAAILYQRTHDDRWRVAAFYYDARPAGTVANPMPFIPPESSDADGDDRTLRLVQLVTLRRDTNLDAHYIEISALATPDREVFRPGQPLLIDGDRANNAETNPFNTNHRPGADEFVRVVRVERRGVNDVRAYLDQQPRFNGRPFLDPLNGPVTRLVNAWALNPQVRSESDQRQWTIHPVMGRVITVR